MHFHVYDVMHFGCDCGRDGCRHRIFLSQFTQDWKNYCKKNGDSQANHATASGW